MKAPAIGIDPQALFAIRDLELRARSVVEGLWSGLHRSPREGFSVEFTEYRQYSVGDDLRYLDWKAMARTDREYIKKFEDETNLRCLLLLDISRSMGFGSQRTKKSEYAKTLAATIARFLLDQRDAVGLGLFDEGVRDYLPPRWKSGHFRRMLAALEKSREERTTALDRAFAETANLAPRRSLILVISDFLENSASWEREFANLDAMGHELRALQILDPAEISLEYGSPAYWTDLESNRRVYVDPSAARESYGQAFADHQDRLRQAFDTLGIYHQTISTDQPLDFALLELLQRGRKTRSRRTASR